MFKLSVNKNTGLTRAMIVISFCLSMFFVDEAKSGQKLSIEEIRQIIPVIESYEKKLISIYIESETWNESRANPEEKWVRTAHSMKGNSWVNGLSGSKMRVDVIKETIGKKNAKNSEVELSYALSFDGSIGKKVHKSIKRNDKITYKKEAEIRIGRPKELDSGAITALAGTRYSMHYLFPEEQRGRSLSGFLKLATSEEMASKLPFEYSGEDFLGVKCFKIHSSDDRKNSFTWWLEPEKGYALRGYKIVNGRKDGSEWLVSSVKVTKLKEAAEDVWYPIEVFEEKEPSRDGEPYLRTIFRALQVSANTQESNQRLFDADIPTDYKIIIDERNPNP